MATILSRFMPRTSSGYMSKGSSHHSKPEQMTQPGAMEPFDDPSSSDVSLADDAEAAGDHQEQDVDMDAEGSVDEDAEGSVDEDAEGSVDEDAEGSVDGDAEGSIDDGAEPAVEEGPASQSDAEEEEGEESGSDVPVSRTRRAQNARLSRAVKHAPAIESATDAEGSQESGSEAEEEWEAGDDEQSEVGDDEAVELPRCVFCQETEENDPSEEFEEMLSCSSCGDHAHQQCTRDHQPSFTEQGFNDWRCPECTETGIEFEQVQRERIRRTSSAPRMIRDLLPVQQSKPGAHTVFGTEIYDDGHKTRHKRKFSAEPSQERERSPKKRKSSEVMLPTIRSVEDLRSVDDRPLTPQGQGSSDQGGTPMSRSSRLRQRKLDKVLVTEVTKTEDQFILSFNVGSKALNHIREETRRRKRRERDRIRREKKTTEHEPKIKMQEVWHYPALQPSSFMSTLFEVHDRDGEQPKAKPYGGILTETGADTTRTFPQLADLKKFENARLKAEKDWKQRLEAAAAEQVRTTQKAPGPPGKIKCIHFGGYEIDTWHSSPYAEDYTRNKVLHVCEFCLKYMNSSFVSWRHKLKCPFKHPPGDEIYHDGKFSFFEVDGRKSGNYCRNLCLLAKLFLGSKTLYYDVEPFLFYVMTENDAQGCHFVGYFSKEKRSSSQNNVSCILVLPIHQRRGFGHMLIEFSYLLTRMEKKTGSPEKPLSDMGLVSYRSYWRYILCGRLKSQKGALSITDITTETGMTPDDVVCALESLRALVRDPVTKAYALRLDFDFYEKYVQTYDDKNYPKIEPNCLMWVPYIMGRTNSHYENAPIQTVAQREDDNPEDNVPEEGVQLAENEVAAKDFAAGKAESMDEVATAVEVNGEGTHTNRAEETPEEGEQPPGTSQPADGQANITPSTPFVNGPDAGDSPIPATRFEVYPPIPGTQKRKPGRPFGRGSGRRGFALRRSTGTSLSGSPNAVAKPLGASARRMRSVLVETLNGDGVDHEEEQATEDFHEAVTSTDGKERAGALDQGEEYEGDE